MKLYNRLKKSLTTLLLLFLFSSLTGCQASPEKTTEQLNYKEGMIDFIAAISDYAKTRRSSFQLITNNGLTLYEEDEVGAAYQQKILAAVDGALMEGYFYSWIYDDNKTPLGERHYLDPPLEVLRSAGKAILNVDYCQNRDNMEKSVRLNQSKRFIAFTADNKELTTLPKYPPVVPGVNGRDINELNDAANMLLLLNPEKFRSKDVYLNTLAATDYDVLIIDAYFDGAVLTEADVSRLKQKQNGGRRLVISYLSIGEAEDYRPYWQEKWGKQPPVWLAGENDDWGGNYKVRYWMPQWQAIVFGSPEAGLDMILAAGFDGIFMDIVDAFQYFEDGEA